LAYLESELEDDDEEAMEKYDQKQEELNELYEYARSQRFSSVSNKATKILAGIGFDEEDQQKLVKEYSGGWRMRISIAKALFNEPDIMILDEPTNHLDLNAVIWLTDYLQNWNKKKNTRTNTLVLVSHDKYFLDGIVDKIIRIDQKKLSYYNGNHRKMLKMIEQERKELEKKWDKKKKSIKSKKMKKKLRPPLKYEVDFTFADPENIQKGSIVLEDVTFKYPGTDVNIFEELDFSIDSGEKITIVGPNGAGKSTLLKMLFNEIEQDDMEEGERLVTGKVKIAKYDQHFNFPMEKTPVEYLQTIYTDWTLTDIRKHLSKYNLESKAHVIPIGKCSGGQKSRLAFATLSEASILILDEPTNHLDMETIDGLSDALEAYEGGIVLVSHDVRLIEQLDCRLYVCGDKQITEFDGDFYDYKDKILEETQLEDSDDESE
jgi:ATP-binding cassette subfamily F protein 1